MARVCELVGKGVLVGNNVSNSNRKTKRRFLPNLQTVHLFSTKLNRAVAMRIATNTLRTIDKKGGIDSFLINSSVKNLTPFAITLRKKLLTVSGANELDSNSSSSN